MAKDKSSILDPSTHNELVDVGSFKRNTKGTPNGAMDGFNFLPHVKMEETPDAVDVVRDAKLGIQAPLFSSSERYTK